MLDSGAEVNVIGENSLQLFHFQKVPCPIRSMSGFGGGSGTVLYWVQLCMTLENAAQYEVVLAVVPDLGGVLILGMPFFLQAHAVPRFHENILDVPEGPVEMFVGKKMKFVNALEVGKNTLPQEEYMKLKAMVKASHLNRRQRRQLRRVLCENAHLWRSDDPGRAEGVTHLIQLDTKYPVVMRPRRYPLEMQKAIDKEINDMLTAGIIRTSKSPHAQEVVMVKKPNGTWRFCIDFRLLNLHTVKDKYPLPRIADLLRSVRNSTHFVALDLRAGYWNIPMAEDSIAYTAFRTARGLFEFLRMPFGLVNAPATFQRAMDHWLGDMRWKGVLVYLDDILIHGRSFKTVLRKLKVVFRRIDQAGLRININKSVFFPPFVKYLGHVFSQQGLRPDLSRLETLDHVKRPTTVSQVRSLVGFFNYYHPFIQSFAKIAQPLFNLLKKGVKVEWTEEHDTAVKTLKEQLAHVVLTNPLSGQQLLLETDASDHAIGAILSCRKSEDKPWRPIEFASKTLGDTARRWPTHEKEAFAIVWALEKFDAYLRGRPFVVRTDNKSLVWMHNASVGKISRWASRMAEYQMEIQHRSGEKMQHVDFLSRYIEEPETGLTDRMLASLITDLPTIEEVQDAQQVEDCPVTRGYLRRDRLIFYRGRVWVPPALRMRTVSSCHHAIPYVHPGVKKTLSTIQKVFNWAGIQSDVASFVHSCLPCQRIRPGVEKLQGLLKRHKLELPFEKVFMDVWSVELQRKSLHLLTMIDSLTRWAECVIIPDHTASTVASAFLSQWVCRFGVPRELVTDQAKEFVGSVMGSLRQCLGIRRVRTTAYHPDSNALIESFHRVLTKGFAHFNLAGSTASISEALSLILMGYRSTVHLSLGDTPAYMTYGVDLRPSQETDSRVLRDSDKERLQFLSLIRLEMMNKARLMALLQEEKLQVGRRPLEFNIGDLVLLPSSREERAFASRIEAGQKVQPTWSLPFRVISVFNHGKSANVRSCLSFRKSVVSIKEVHVQNARFIGRPQTEEQRQLWQQSIETALTSTMMDPEARRDVIERFWTVVDHPEAFVEELPPQKKRRLHRAE